LTLSPKPKLIAALIRARSLDPHWSAQERNVDRTEFAQVNDAPAFDGEVHFCVPSTYSTALLNAGLHAGFSKKLSAFFSAGKQRYAHNRY
jgi:hypothetical protein